MALLAVSCEDIPSKAEVEARITTNDILNKEPLSDGSRVRTNKINRDTPTLYGSKRCWKIGSKFRCIDATGIDSFINVRSYSVKNLYDQIPYKSKYWCSISLSGNEIKLVVEKIQSNNIKFKESTNLIYSDFDGLHSPWTSIQRKAIAAEHGIDEIDDYINCHYLAAIIAGVGLSTIETTSVGPDIFSDGAI